METTEVSFSAKDVMALREKTGLPMMDCKKALEANGGDPVQAEAWLREQRKGKMEKRTERATAEGRLGVAVDGGSAVIVEVRTETDFTARNEDFVRMVEDVAGAALQAASAGAISPDAAISKRIDDLRITTGENVNFARGVKLEGGAFGSYLHHDGKRACILQVEGEVDPEILKSICQHIVAMDPAGVSDADIPREKLEEIRSEALQEAKDSGKPDEIAGKIAEGKVRKFLEENTLLKQKYVADPTKTIEQRLPSGAKIVSFVRYTLGG